VQKTRILLVDDEPDAVKALQFRLQKAGYDVFTANNGAEALQKLRQSPVDLVLADFMMPEVNGLELTRLVNQNPHWHKTRVMLFSCNTDPEFRRRALELGALDYLPKTESFESILARVVEIVKPDAARSPSPGGGDKDGQETTFRRQLASLSQALVDMLRVAQLGGELPDPTRLAIESAQRIAGDIRCLTGEGAPEHGELAPTDSA
jgi:DNA-binding response OmpR family regulator